ncbi:hypothetical protein CRE_22067 [Caenorhabditis remanei]|uniref:Mos1 transposase HTH domain-containing protein n=1 Tax=Caenorhabditis remanei TaxID=31234 RepID=E3N8U3_CAERE|nr:hypothetical protein CRE_22067 [Caenorhabditis remanei]
MVELLAKDRNALKGCFMLGYLPGLSAMETYRNITETLGEEIITYKTTITWFKKFKEENYNADDKSHSGRPRLDIDDDITDVLEDEPRSSTSERIWKNSRIRTSCSHELTDSQLKLSCELSQSLLRRKRSFDWILDIVTGNEKWGLYVYHTCGKECYNDCSTTITPFYNPVNIPITRGVRQGDPISPNLFSACLETAFSRMSWPHIKEDKDDYDNSPGIRINGRNLTHLRFADDIRKPKFGNF